VRKIFLTLSTLVLAVAARADITIVKDGRPQAVIITAEKPTSSAQRAAEELQHFVHLMSGANLAIQTEAAPFPPNAAQLLVGRSKFTAKEKIPSGTDRNFSHEGFIVKSRRNALVLAGNEDSDVNGSYHGTEYAVYELLERLGCRWYFPGEFGQVVPKLQTVTIPDIDITQRPSFAVRNIWISGQGDVGGHMAPWLMRNKGTPARTGFAFPGDGTIQYLAPLEKYAKLFPEIYAMGKDGKRQDEKTVPHDTMLCMSNAKGLQISVQTICDYFRANPQANSYGFAAPDTLGVCLCPDCSARNHGFFQDSDNLESDSDPYFNFVNNVAWEVNKVFPDKYIVTLAYLTRVVPAEGLDRPWNPRIIVQFAPYRHSTKSPIGSPTDVFALRQERTLKAWARDTPKLLMYDYDPHADISRMPFWRSRAIASDMRFYKKNNVVGFTTEGNYTYFRTGLNYYIRARCMWDVNANPEALLDDFYKRFFGEAATPMKQVGESIEAMLQASPDHFAWHPINMDWTPTYPPAKVAELEPLLGQAEKLASTPELKQRVRLYRVLHNYMTDYLRVYTLQHEGKYTEALAVLDTLPKTLEEADSIHKGMLPPDTVEANQGLANLRCRLAPLAERVGGNTGELLGRAPTTAQFLPDPKNIGLYDQWQREEIGARQKWLPINLTRSWGVDGFRDAQGYAYDGIGWYRIAMHIKKPEKGRAQLTVPMFFAEKTWVWVNGYLVSSPSQTTGGRNASPTPGRSVQGNSRGFMSLNVDIHDQLRPDAENIITFRMQGTLERTQHRGIAEVPFVWEPK